MRDYWLNKLFFDIQQPAVAAEFKKDRDAVLRRRDPVAYASAALLLTEGAALLVGRGNCPFGPFQARLGDPVPMFAWVLPPRAAKAAVPILAVVTITTLVALVLRPPINSAS